MSDDRYRATLQALFDAVASRTAMRKDSDGGFWFNGFASKAIKDAMRDADLVLARAIEDILAAAGPESEPTTATEIVEMERNFGRTRPDPGTDTTDNGLQGT